MQVFEAKYTKEGDWYAAEAVEVPGALTQGKTIAEAEQNLKEAIALVLNIAEDSFVIKNKEIVKDKTS